MCIIHVSKLIFLPQLAVHLFGSTQGGFRLFQSGGVRYGNNYNLLFSDDTTQIESLVEEQQTFKSYLGNDITFFMYC